MDKITNKEKHMATPDFGQYFLDNLEYDGGLYAAGLIGFILAIVFWKRSPTASVLVLIGSILLIGAKLGWLIAYYNAMFYSYYESPKLIYLISGIAIGLAFLLAVVGAFIGRKPAVSSPVIPQYPGQYQGYYPPYPQGQYPQYPPAQYPPAQYPPVQVPPAQVPPAQPPQNSENPQN
jgi:hypothetical protein